MATQYTYNAGHHDTFSSLLEMFGLPAGAAKLVGQHLASVDNGYQDRLIAKLTALMAKREQAFQMSKYPLNPAWTALMRMFGLPPEVAVVVADGLNLPSWHARALMPSLVVELAKKIGVAEEAVTVPA
jgi:hypothetical protein